MMAIANLQYAWTLFTVPIAEKLHTSLSAVQWAFSFFVFTQTWTMPIEATVMEKIGPRTVVSVSALLVGASWVGAGLATSLPVLYLAYAIGGIGAGAVYSASVGLAIKWFPDRRGLCVGATVGAYGFGSAFTIVPISRMIDHSGYGAAFVTWGAIQGAVVLMAAQAMKDPPPGWSSGGQSQTGAPNTGRLEAVRDYAPAEMLRTSTFYVLYLMMILVAFGGLMVTAQLKPITASYGLDNRLMFGTLTALNVALLLDRILNGMTRPFWGWLSDKIGRYDAMALAFSLESLAILGLMLTASHPLIFVIMSGLTFFAWGEIYSLFPAAIADIFGSRHATTNFSLQYTAKGIAAVLAGPGAALLVALANSWLPVLAVAALCDFIAALLALLWLKRVPERLSRLSS
jgi:OFA family oxalate/formate antiporter-like MFS transporter